MHELSDTSSESIATPVAINCCRSRDPTPHSEQQGQGLSAYRPITNPNHTFDPRESSNFQSLILRAKADSSLEQVNYEVEDVTMAEPVPWRKQTTSRYHQRT